jgi:hypothetical protein
MAVSAGLVTITRVDDDQWTVVVNGRRSHNCRVSSRHWRLSGT